MKTQFITNDSGKKLAVILPIKEYEQMIEAIEEAEDIKLYDSVKIKNESSINIETAFKKLDAKRSNK
jgi:PHD/YefM family antitoxin component YafN of YafNO toxin-antitoxin module